MNGTALVSSSTSFSAQEMAFSSAFACPCTAKGLAVGSLVVKDLATTVHDHIAANLIHKRPLPGAPLESLLVKI